MLEAVETYIPVTAKQIGDNVFEIVNNEAMDLDTDATCIYQFFPGDIVETKMENNFSLPIQKRKESILIAIRLINSTFPNRKLYQLIFIIVESLGEVEKSKLKGYEEEIDQLCINKNIFQRNHPVVRNWLIKNCNTNKNS